MQLFCRLSLPPRSLLNRKHVTFSKTRRGCRHANLVNTLGVTQCDLPPPPPPFEKSHLHLLLIQTKPNKLKHKKVILDLYNNL